ncbi:MAG: hypothetical protein R8L53_04525 [Mariprofundales bacterium]
MSGIICWVAMGAKPRRKDKIEKNRTNFNDVLIRFIDVVYNLINTGNIVGLILIFFCIIILFILQKTSQNVFDQLIIQLFSIEYFYIIPLLCVLLVSMVANYFQHTVYKTHINELITTRKELIHGLATGNLKQIKRHRTSGINSLESDNDS